jgi:hypothetical protein
MNLRFLTFFATILLASAGLAQAQFQYANGSLLTMDEVSFQPINGLTVKGVTFADTTGANYNAGDGGTQFYTQDPVIEGTTAGEAITMTFVTPITSLSFGFALLTQATLPNAVQVQLFDPAGNSLGTFFANGRVIGSDNFTGGEFTGPNVGLIAKAVVTFPAATVAAAPAFGLDNLAVFNPQEYQIRYGANLNVGESYIDITNTGTGGAPLLGPGIGAASGNICVNVYAFDPSEELVSCCSCLVTPDQTVNLGIIADLTSKTLTGVVPTSVTVTLVPTVAGGAGGSGTGTVCTNSAAGVTAATLANGLAAYGTTLHPTPTAKYATTETQFAQGTLSLGELASITGRCAAIIGNASGFGICTSCRSGALGGQKL